MSRQLATEMVPVCSRFALVPPATRMPLVTEFRSDRGSPSLNHMASCREVLKDMRRESSSPRHPCHP